MITGYKDKHEFERNGIKSTVYLMDCMDLMKHHVELTDIISKVTPERIIIAQCCDDTQPEPEHGDFIDPN